MPVNKGNGIWKAIKNLFNIDFIEFNTEYSDGNVEGRMQWNTEDGVPEVGLSGGVVNGQMFMETLIKVTNKTGALIPNGSAVYVNGAQGSRPTVALAKADSTVTAITFIGLATEDIANNGNGYVTTLGQVRELNTSAFNEGDILYLSPTVAGGLTNIRPVHPNYTIGIGACLRKNNTEGIIGVLARLYPDVNRVSGNSIVWKDINAGAVNFGGPAVTYPSTVQFVDKNGTNTGIYTLGFAVGEKVSGDFELQHDYKEGSDFYFHFHFQGTVAPTGIDKLQFRLTWAIGQFGVPLEPVQTMTIETDYDTQYEFLTIGFGAITGTNFKIGDQFLFTFERIAASIDEYAGNAVLATLGLHYQVDSVGSRNMTSKG